MSDKQENSNIEITIYGASGSGKTTLAIGLYASSTNNDGKSAFSVSSQEATTDDKLTKLMDTIQDGDWVDATSYEVDFKLYINREGKQTSISFSDYKGEELAGNTEYVDKIVNRDADGILILLNPGMKVFTDEKKSYSGFLSALKRDIEKIYKKNRSRPIGIVTTASDRLDTDLKTKRDKFDKFKDELDTFLKSTEIPYESFNTTICGNLEDQNKPKIAKGNENTTSKPFLWIIDEIEKRKKEEQRKKRNEIFKIRFISVVLVVLLISGILFACSYVQNSKQKKKYTEFSGTECKDWETYYNLSTNINSYIEDNNISNTNLLNSFICLMNTNIIKCAQNLDSLSNKVATSELLEKYKGKTDSLYISTTNELPSKVKKVFLNEKEKEFGEILIPDSTESNSLDKINEANRTCKENKKQLEKLKKEIEEETFSVDFKERKDDLVQCIDEKIDKITLVMEDLSKKLILLKIEEINKKTEISVLKKISKTIQNYKQEDQPQLQTKFVDKISSVVEDENDDESFLCDLKEELEKTKFLGDKTDSVLTKIDDILTKNCDDFIAKHINVNHFEFNKKFLYELEGFLKQHEKNPHKDKVIQALANKCDELIQKCYEEYKDRYTLVTNYKTDDTIKNEFVGLCEELGKLVDQVNKCIYLEGKKCYNFAKEITDKNNVTFDKKFAKKIEINKITISYELLNVNPDPDDVYVNVKYGTWDSKGKENFDQIFKQPEYKYDNNKYLVKFTEFTERSEPVSDSKAISVGSFSCLIFEVDGVLRRVFWSNSEKVEKGKHTFGIDEINDGVREINDKILDGEGCINLKLEIEVKITEDKSFTTIFNKYYGTNK